MKHSEAITDLFTALAKAQGEFGPVTKEKTGTITDTRKYKYADLAATMEAVTPALSRNGLAFIQPAGTVDDRVIITSMLVHGPSGQWVSEEYAVPLFSKAQDQGSALTYGRRYSAWSLLGIAPEDDDGKAAQETQDAKPSRAKEQKPPKDAPAPTEELVTAEEAKAVRDGIKGLFSILKGEELAAACHAFLTKVLPGVATTRDIPKSKLKEINDAVEAERKSRDEAAKPVDEPAPVESREPGSDG